MKKFLSILAVLAMVLGLSACSTTSKVKTIKVGVAIYKFDDTFMTNYRTEMEAYFKTLSTDKITYAVTTVDGKNDQVTQTEQIDNFIAQKYDVLVVNLVDLTAASTIIGKVKAANIPTVFINRQPSDADMALWDRITYVGAKAEDSGTYQGQIIADLWKAPGSKLDVNKDGVLQYVMLMGQAIHQDAALRTEYSIKALVDASIKVEKLYEDRGDWDRVKGQEKMATAITQFGNRIEVVFGNNDDMALGAIEALKAANMTTIPVVGVDATPAALDAVAKGTLVGTVLNDSKGQSHTSADSAIKLLNKAKVEKLNWVPYVKVTPANYKDFIAK